MRPIKILHTGDVHLGAKFSFLGPGGREHRQQLLATFSRTVDLAITSQVDYFLIAGDLFDSNFPSPHPRRPAGRTETSGDEGIEVLLVPGTHDRLNRDCIYNQDIWAPCLTCTSFARRAGARVSHMNTRRGLLRMGYNGLAARGRPEAAACYPRFR